MPACYRNLVAVVVVYFNFNSVATGSPTDRYQDPTHPNSDLKSDNGVINGDIKYPVGKNGERTALKNVRIWPNGEVPYTVDGSIGSSYISILTQAIQEIQSTTCIKFKLRTTEPNYLLFTNIYSQGCWSWIGQQGGRQTINLDISQGCFHKGVIIHEILHALGFYHEQSRTDRDNFVTINWNNIMPNARPNFNIENNAATFGEPYDYSSIMHYGARDFAMNQYIATIIPKQTGAQIGQRTGLSTSDLRRLKTLYSCKEVAENISTVQPSTCNCKCPA